MADPVDRLLPLLKQAIDRMDDTIIAFQTVHAEFVRIAMELELIAPPTSDKPLIWPTSYRPVYIVSKFGVKRTVPFTFDHEGFDISCPVGTTLLAAADGVVEYAGLSATKFYGLRVRIKHTIGNKTIRTWYCHLSKVIVAPGRAVKQGDIIGLSGGDPKDQPNSGNSTGAHLHFGVQVVGDKTRLTGWSEALTGSVDPLLWVQLP